MWSLVLVMVALVGMAWLFVAAVAVGLAEGGASRSMKRTMYLALVVVVLAGAGAALVSYR